MKESELHFLLNYHYYDIIDVFLLSYMQSEHNNLRRRMHITLVKLYNYKGKNN